VVAEIEAGILAGLAAIGEVSSVPMHGDLKPQHVVFDADRVVLLDLDTFGTGEPMLDVTSILIALRHGRKSRRGKPGVLARAVLARRADLLPDRIPGQEGFK
jgi:aminoglycoside phosphotransferase (APT) family kinase protein